MRFHKDDVDQIEAQSRGAGVLSNDLEHEPVVALSRRDQAEADAIRLRRLGGE